MGADDDREREAAIAAATATLLPPAGTILTDGSDRAAAAVRLSRERKSDDGILVLGASRPTAAAMRARHIRAVVVSALSLAANGDAIAAIGTYDQAVLAAHHGVPFYVLARRDALDSGAAGPAPDVESIPGRLIAAIVTEYGAARPPYGESLGDLRTRPTGLFGGKVWESNPPAPLRGPQQF